MSLARLTRNVARFEGALVLLFGLGVQLVADRKILVGKYVFQSDVRLVEFWMRRFRDADLFRDPLTEAMLDSGYVPPGFRALYWMASRFVDPIQFSELLPLILAPITAWLVFRIVRLHTAWWPAAWLGAILFLLPIDIHRFSGGHQRAFAHLIVLLTVYLLLRRRVVWAALVPPVGVLLYPAAAVVALGILAVSALDPGRARWIDVRRAGIAAGSAVAFALAGLLPGRLSGQWPELITREVAHRYPDFGPNGRPRFFVPSTLEYLSKNLSGFNLHWSGSILVCAVIVLLLVRPRNVRLLRREVWAMPLVGLVLFGLAHALLFRLYIPHRYTYPLLPFSAIAIAVAWKPTWQSLIERRRRPWLVAVVGAAATLAVGVAALIVFPLGLRLSPEDAASLLREKAWYVAGALAVGLVLAALAYRRSARWVAVAAVAAALLVGQVAAAGSDYNPGIQCRSVGLLRYLETLPKDTIIAGNPVRLDCVPVVSQRAVVMNAKLFQVWEVGYWVIGRERMFDSIRAYYGESLDDVLGLRERYGADYLVVEDKLVLGGWGGFAPFTSVVKQMRRTVDDPVVHRLPADCTTWTGKRYRVYDLACIEERARS